MKEEKENRGEIDEEGREHIGYEEGWNEEKVTTMERSNERTKVKRRNGKMEIKGRN